MCPRFSRAEILTYGFNLAVVSKECHHPSPRSPVVLSVAGSDSLAGAGAQADLKTAAALGAYCCNALTAVTAQNSREFVSSWALPKEAIERQLRAIAEDVTIAAVKTGMLGSRDAVEAICAHLDQTETAMPVVVDTVLSATVGGSLLGGSRECEASTMECLRKELIPRATLITPNISEAAILLGTEEAKNKEDMEEQARSLLSLGSEAVVLKGGHLHFSETEAAEEKALTVDCLVDAAGVKFFSGPRLSSKHTHGSGCSFAMAIAVGLAKRKTLRQAIHMAKEFVSSAIKHAETLNIVASNGPLNHFYSMKNHSSSIEK